MRREDWNAVASDYGGRILSVFDHDKKRVIRGAIREFASPSGVAIDFGCGEGNFLPELSERFIQVMGWDYSEGLLKEAAKRARRRSNIELTCVDLSKKVPMLPGGDFVLSVNVLLSPDATVRGWLWDNLASKVRRGGALVLVVPSVESAMLANVRMVEWNRRGRVSMRKAVADAYDLSEPEAEAFASDGLVNLDGVLTKHFLREELELMAASAGFSVQRFEKIEYPWSTEFNMPPAWMKAPYPWDWMMVATRS